jgi:stage V sporulation protein AA
MEETIYVRLRHRIQARPHETVLIGDIAEVIGSDQIEGGEIEKIPIYHLTIKDKTIVVLDIVRVIRTIRAFHSNLDIQVIGPSQTLVEIVFRKRKFTLGFLVLIWFLLFIGAGLTIMNFHEDVSMQEVHQRIFTLITGRFEARPLLLQIPYSIGLGLGMILFFNHLFKKRLNEEPSPLEVEMFNYQQDLDHYLIMNENKESMKKLDDH